MKRLLAPFLALSPSLFIFGQSPLIRADMLAPGNTVHMHRIQHFADVDTTIQGNNVVWDFTALAEDLDQPVFDLTIVDPVNTPYAAYYPEANYCWHEMPSNNYRYFHLTDEKMERLGSVTTGMSFYSDPQVEYVFPMSVGVANTDTWAGTGGSGIYMLNCVGSGTLVLPNVTFENAWMVRVLNSVAGITLKGFAWLNANGATVIQYIGDPQDGFPLQGVFAADIANAVDDGMYTATRQAWVSGAVGNEVVVDLAEHGRDLFCSVFSANGALLRDVVSKAGTTQERFPVQDLAPGMYFIRVADGELPGTTLRFVRE